MKEVEMRLANENDIKDCAKIISQEQAWSVYGFDYKTKLILVGVFISY